MSQHFVVDRDGEPSLEFSGEQLSQVDSQRPGKPAWTELVLYRTDGGTYVVQTIARVVEGHKTRGADGAWREWVDWYSARKYEDLDGLLDGLRDKKRGGGAYSGLSLMLLDEAAGKDDDIDQHLSSREAGREKIS